MANEYVIPKIVQYLHMRAEKMHVPLSGTFELSPLCNMDCRMCYVKMTQQDMRDSGGRMRTVDEWLSLAKAAQSQGMLLLLLTGGEPFLWPHFRELYTELKKLGLVISINSNGTMIDEETVEWLKQDPPSRINITLYGASDETYDRLCRNPKGFSQATHAIQLLRKAGIVVKLNCSITPYNYQDVPKILDYAEEQKLILQASSYMFPPIRRDEAKVGTNDRFSPEEAAEKQADLVFRQRGEEWFRHHVEALRTGAASVPHGEEDCQPKPGEMMHCRAGKSAFWITWDGRMLACGMMNRPAAYPFEDGFHAAWNQIIKDAAKIRLPAACANCASKKQCGTCAAMVMTETGTYSKKPEYRCKMQKAYLDACESKLKQVQRNLNEVNFK